LKLCHKRTWNERGMIEMVFSFLTEVCLLKKLFYRQEVHLEAHLCYLAVVINLLLTLAGTSTTDQMLPVLKDSAF
jgi:hypothetical protein